MHNDIICESFECDPRKCNLRHPKVCSFYRDYNYCKFLEYCSFSHNIRNDNNDALEKEIVEIRKQLDLLKEKENYCEKEIIKLSEKNN